MSAVCSNEIMKYLKYHSCISKIYLFSNKLVKQLNTDWKAGFRFPVKGNVYFYCPVVSTIPQLI